MGAYLAECFIRDKSLPFVRWPPVLILIAAIMLTFFKPTFAFSFLLFSLLTAVVLARFISGLWSIQNYYLALACRHLSALGVVSYSFYLLHDPILTLVLQLKNYQGQIHPLLIFGIFLTLYMPILFMANIFYRFIEMPSIKIGRTLATSIHGTDQLGRVAKFRTFVPKPEV